MGIVTIIRKTEIISSTREAFNPHFRFYNVKRIFISRNMDPKYFTKYQKSFGKGFKIVKVRSVVVIS